ncbi:hypothetical protein ACEWY4_019857 [Coilia grayii]|uniref:C2H2-type domain-containing protein n=1 Tax=Coilia grayii TaxID=363190 RepID=A0ABD1JC44_9TELE
MEVINGEMRELGASREGVTAESDPEPRIPCEESPKSLSSVAAVPENRTHGDTVPKKAVQHPGVPKEAASAPHLPDKQINSPSSDPAATKTTTSEITHQKREDSILPPKETTQGPKAAPGMKKDGGTAGVNTAVRRNIPPKKDRMDPLKLDMTKLTLMPLTSSQLSLQCLECHIIFSDDKSKQRHLKSTHPAEYEQCMLGDSLFACYVCDRHFANSTELMAHQRAHKEKQPFKCILCGAAFNRLSQLTNHKRVHSNSLGYKCSDCNRLFKTLTLLKYHKRTHTGEKPYVCKECGKRFSMPKALQKHLETHNQDEGEENSNQTNTSPKAKKQRSNGPSERKFSCSHCKAMFKTMKTQLHHLNQKHTANKNVPLIRALATQLPQNQGPPLLTQATIGQSPVLRLDSGGQTPQCIEPEQIKRLIESLGNVQKVNQLVIYGLEPVSYQSQTLNLQPVPGVVQPIRFDMTQTGPPVELKLVAEETKTLNSEQAKQQVGSTGPQLNEGQGKTNAYSSAEKTQLAEQMQNHTGTLSSVTLQPQGRQLDQVSAGAEKTVTMEETCAAVETIMCESISFKETDEVRSGTKSIETQQEAGQMEVLQLQLSSSLIPTNELENDSGHMVSLQEEEVQMQYMTSSDALSLVAIEGLQQTEGQAVTLTPEETQSVTLMPAASEKESKKTAGIVSEQDVGQPHLETFVEPKDSMEQTALNISQFSSDVHFSEEISVHTQPSPDESNTAEVTTSVAKPLTVKKGRPAKKKSNKTKSKMQIHDDTLKQKSDCNIAVSETHQRNIAPHPPLQVITSVAQEQAKTKGHILVKFGLGNKKEKLSKTVGATKASKKGEDGKLQEKGEHQQEQRGEKGKGQIKTYDKKTRTEIPNKPQDEEQHVLQKEETKPQVKSRKRKLKMNKSTNKSLTEKEVISVPLPKKKKKEKIMKPKAVRDTSEKEVTKKNTLKLKQNRKEEIPVAVSPDQVKSDALLLLKGHKQPQLKVHKLDAPKTLQPELVPSCTTPVACNEEMKSTPVKQTGDHKNKLTMSKNLKRQIQACKESASSPHPKGSSLRKKAKVGRKKKTTKLGQIVPTSPSLGCNSRVKFSEGSVLQQHNSCEAQKDSGHITSAHVRTAVSNEILPSNLLCPKTLELQVTTDWDADMEMGELGLGDREDQSVSFPALNPSPSLPHVPALVEGENEEVKKDGNSVTTENCSHSEGSKGSQTVACLESTPVSQTPSQLSSTPLSESAHVTVPKDQNTAAMSSPQGKNKTRKRKKNLLATGNKISNIQDSPEAIQTTCEPDKIVEEDVKEDLPQDVNLVTVQEENQPISPQDGDPSESSQKDCEIASGVQVRSSCRDENESNHEYVSPKKNFEPVVNEKSTETSAMKDSSTNPPEIKEENAENTVHTEERKCEPNRNNMVRGRKRGGGRGRRGTGKKRNTGSRPSAEQEPLNDDPDECQIVYQLYPVAGDTAAGKSQEEKGPQVCTDPPRSDLAESQEDSSEEKVVFELESVTTSVVEMVKSEAELDSQDRTQGSSPGLLLEKFLTSREGGSSESAASNQVVADSTNIQNSGASADHRTTTLPTVGTPGALGIKEEELSQPVMPPVLLPEAAAADARGPLINSPLPVEQQQGVQMFVVKEEDPLVLNEPQGSPHTPNGKRKDGPLSTSSVAESEPPVESDIGERSVCGSELGMVASPIHQPSAKQCIFFPVKEEERELLLDSPRSGENQSNSGFEECDDICEISQHDVQCVDSGFIDEDERGGNEHSTGDLVEFLSQSSDTENSGFFDYEPEAENLALTRYYGNRTSGSANLPAGSSHLPDDKTSQLSQNDVSSQNGQRKPIDYFTQYFDWKTWQDVANITAKTSTMPNPVTAKEVSRFVGIHIAMGSLQFPSTKLYWEEYTRVPLIADAMTSSRFSELLSKVRFAEEGGDPARPQGSGNAVSAPSTVRQSGHHSPDDPESDAQGTTEARSTQSDPLNRVRVLVEKVQRACRNLRREGSHGVSQYPLGLLRSTDRSPYSLHHTVMLSTSGLVVDFSLSLDDSDREETVKKMVLSGEKSTEGVVFLCKPELSIPSMLEQLLDAGVQSAGKVGGARGQVGDEFVSSDGKLKLFRCHHGFILSAAVKGRSRSTSLVSGFERALRAAKLNRDLRSTYRTPCLSSSPAAWPLAVLWHLTDLALVNSWLEHRDEQSSKQAPLSLVAFRLEVSKALILSSSADAQDATPPQPPAPQRSEQGAIPGSTSIFETPLPDAAIRYDGLGHWPEQVAEGEGARCRFGGCDRTSQVRCLKCCVFLCISRNHNCFLKFHNQGAV